MPHVCLANAASHKARAVPDFAFLQPVENQRLTTSAPLPCRTLSRDCRATTCDKPPRTMAGKHPGCAAVSHGASAAGSDSECPSAPWQADRRPAPANGLLRTGRSLQLRNKASYTITPRYLLAAWNLVATSAGVTMETASHPSRPAGTSQCGVEVRRGSPSRSTVLRRGRSPRWTNGPSGRGIRS